ncbi:acylneuraminate cytidylyltransferase, spore coat polysaccharide biosynthesis protein spsF [Candidatus Magnetobacterium bavaricum]|uniref:Acylneuraminate cytidylyltransferase, spore coat polysaccharide biosynthesis protein spsF n=1 Tax=Candidatus Magnetobacterium bavaricum TaxID=29290 RepID=A0A0F3GJI9_9BACT|nr:acylneuraminate cytidylyltransferase, spore coat polysaccharide biosynthesis protein spsF [Candidatus Magnetobacterium bavaricum]
MKTFKIDKIPAVIQARMGSTRLPGKVLMDLAGFTMLEHLIIRLCGAKNVSYVLVITSTDKKDDEIYTFCYEKNIECFRGSENDVLDRYYKSAKKYNMTNLIRVTGDNPFTDIEELDNLVELHFQKKADYSINKEETGTDLPAGAGCEVFSFEMLEECWKKGLLPHHREHVNDFILENMAVYNVCVATVPEYKKRKNMRITVDTHEDFERAKNILHLIPKPSDKITMQDIIELFDKKLIK